MKIFWKKWHFPGITGQLLLSVLLMGTFSGLLFAQEPVEVPISEVDVGSIQSVTENFLSNFMTSTINTMEFNQNILDNDGNPVPDVTIRKYYWDGEYHVWEKVIDEGPLHLESMTKIQYRTEKDGTIVKNPAGATYMYIFETTQGTFGFTPDDPTHGVEFCSHMEMEWVGFNTPNFDISAKGTYKEINHAIYNGQEAILNFIVCFDIKNLRMSDTRPNTLTLSGYINLKMDPWEAIIFCDGSDIARITILKNGSQVLQYDINLATLIGGQMPPSDMMDVVINADDEYRLWVNGVEVTPGPGHDVWNQADWYRVPYIDRPEENVFAVWLNNRGNVGGLLLEAFVEGVPVFQTDGSWVFNKYEYEGWYERDFIDTGWEPVIVDGPYPDTPPWDNQIKGFPVPTNAQWIHGSEDDGFFRGVFKLDDTRPGGPIIPPPPPPPLAGTSFDAIIHINGDDIYELYLNGTFIGKNSKWNTAQRWPVSLLDGLNTMEVKLTNRGNVGALIADVRVDGVPIFWTQATDWQYNLEGFDSPSWLPVVDLGQYPYAQPWGDGIFYFPENSPAHWIVAAEGDGDGFYKGTFNYSLTKHSVSDEPRTIIPTKFDLGQNYPNPFNPSTSIKYQLPEATNVVIKIYDVTGREIRTLVNNFREAGSYVVRWDATDQMGNKVSSGVYFYKMVAGSYLMTKKMILLP